MGGVDKPGSRKVAKRVAMALLDGNGPAAACREAGYSEITAHKKGWKIAQSKAVIQELRKMAALIDRKALSEVAEAKLLHLLTSEETDSRTMVVAIRLAKELTGEVGAGRIQEHQHMHMFSPETEERIARRMAELVKPKELPEAVDA